MGIGPETEQLGVHAQPAGQGGILSRGSRACEILVQRADGGGWRGVVPSSPAILSPLLKMSSPY